jgi:hypothetical protein
MTKSEKEELERILDEMYADDDQSGYVVTLVDTIRRMIDYRFK